MFFIYWVIFNLFFVGCCCLFVELLFVVGLNTWVLCLCKVFFFRIFWRIFGSGIFWSYVGVGGRVLGISRVRVILFFLVLICSFCVIFGVIFLWKNCWKVIGIYFLFLWFSCVRVKMVSSLKMYYFFLVVKVCCCLCLNFWKSIKRISIEFVIRSGFWDYWITWRCVFFEKIMRV